MLTVQYFILGLVMIAVIGIAQIVAGAGETIVGAQIPTMMVLMIAPAIALVLMILKTVVWMAAVAVLMVVIVDPMVEMMVAVKIVVEGIKRKKGYI